jgi:hypothetical protein
LSLLRGCSVRIRLGEGWGSADRKHHGRRQANQRPRMNIENAQLLLLGFDGLSLLERMRSR